MYYLKYDATGLTPFCFTGPEISPFLNECEALYGTTKTVYVREGVMNMALSKHGPRAEGIRGQLTEFHTERKRIQNFGLRR
jgi:hypothetical protein